MPRRSLLSNEQRTRLFARLTGGRGGAGVSRPAALRSGEWHSGWA